MSGIKKTTLLDVARAAGVSKTTASQALNGKGWVAPATREAVQRLAREMGYEADPLAQRLSNGRCAKTVGYFTLDLDLSGRTRQMQVIQAELSDRGFSVPIYAYGYRGCGDLQNQLALVKALLAQRPVAIVCNTSGVRPEVLEYLARFIDEGGIVVAYGYGVAANLPCDQVVFDEAHSTYLAARHLLDLGHRELGLFNVGQRVPEGAMLEGYVRALGEFGIDVKPEWLFRNEGILRYEEEGEVLAQHFLQMKNRPTGMVIANDYSAVAFVSTLMRAGIYVPRDVSVVGDDDHPIARHCIVPLTTVTYPLERIAQELVSCLTSRLDGNKQAAQHIWVRGEFVERESASAGPLKPRSIEFQAPIAKLPACQI